MSCSTVEMSPHIGKIAVLVNLYSKKIRIKVIQIHFSNLSPYVFDKMYLIQDC